MIMTYNECLERVGTNYNLKKSLASGKVFQIEKGIYSDSPDASPLAVITAKYPNAIITMDSAFYYHDLTDVIPQRYCLATDKHSYPIKDRRVWQFYLPSDILNVGVTTMTVRDATFKIYDKERMLIELLRYKNKLSFDYYKEILQNYRDQMYDLDIERIEEYADAFPKHKMIDRALEMEVF